jgi:hypothetical protein
MQDRAHCSVLRALPPIAIGHELSIALVAALVVALGVFRGSAGASRRGGRSCSRAPTAPVRWSPPSRSGQGRPSRPTPATLGRHPAAALNVTDAALAISLHVGARLAVMAVVALDVYDKLGRIILRKAGLNSDRPRS